MSNGTINKAIIQGRLARDPEVRFLPSGMAVCNMRVATNTTRKDKDSGQRIDETEWHSISLFDKRAETAGQLLKKGWLVHFEGKITTRKYTDKDGVERYATEIRADEFQIIIGDKREAGGEGGEGGAPARAPAPAAANRGASKPAAAPAAGPDGDDDIPF